MSPELGTLLGIDENRCRLTSAALPEAELGTVVLRSDYVAHPPSLRSAPY